MMELLEECEECGHGTHFSTLWFEILSKKHLCTPCYLNARKEANDPEVQHIKSTGGATDYYKLPEHATELRHLISHKNMSKSRGDVFKACYRLGEKEGTDILYDLNKMKFFVQDLIEMYERNERL